MNCTLEVDSALAYAPSQTVVSTLLKAADYMHKTMPAKQDRSIKELRCRLDNSIPAGRKVFIFTEPALVTTQEVHTGCSFPGVKGRGVKLSLPSNTEVKIVWNYTSTPL